MMPCCHAACCLDGAIRLSAASTHSQSIWHASCAQKVTIITKIVIIKKYSCEGDGWSCKGSDYCDVRPDVWCWVGGFGWRPALPCMLHGGLPNGWPCKRGDYCGMTRCRASLSCGRGSARFEPARPAAVASAAVHSTSQGCLADSPLSGPPLSCSPQGGKHWGCPEGTKCDPNWDGKGGELASWDSAFLLS